MEPNKKLVCCSCTIHPPGWTRGCWFPLASEHNENSREQLLNLHGCRVPCKLCLDFGPPKLSILSHKWCRCESKSNLMERSSRRLHVCEVFFFLVTMKIHGFVAVTIQTSKRWWKEEEACCILYAFWFGFYCFVFSPFSSFIGI